MEELSKCEKLIKDSAHELLDALEWRIRHRQARNIPSKKVDFEELCKMNVGCEHPRAQEIMWSKYDDIQCGPYLHEGWKTLGIIEDRIVLQRLKPCDLCEKV